MKRLVVCCDGTWNHADQVHDGKACPTNVTLVARNLEPVDSVGVMQIGYYHEGVGVKRWERLRGGAAGYGLEEHVRDVYLWLAQGYSEGDEIFLFGFSRGAYTVRSTVGMIRTSGLLGRDGCMVRSDWAHEAYDLYRRANGDPDIEEARRFRAEYSVADRIPIKFIGVWDTVGARGIPLSGSRLFNIVNRRYRFHNVTLTSWVDNAYQALAIDEHRGPFEPAIWVQSPTATNTDQTLEQVWFAGVHSDIGGGYPERETADLSLRWMLARAAEHGLAVKSITMAPLDPTAVSGDLHNSFDGFYRFVKPFVRDIGRSDPRHEAAASTANRRFEENPEYQPENLRTYLGSPSPNITDIGATSSL